MKILFSQFSKPAGWIGKWFGWYMAKENKHINQWTINFLDIQEQDHIVEIGFGPGQAIMDMLKRHDTIYITGVDPSEAMVHQVLKKLNKRLTNGQIGIFQHNADEFPILHKKIDKVLAINNITFWKYPVKTLAKIRMQMNQNGKIAITLRPHERGATDQTTRLLGNQLKAILAKAGFREICIFIKKTNPNDTVCAVGQNTMMQ
ncbi:class I SAM-dependent methyltransferase [Virgibacillus oceani]|uniref:Methyltransferase YdaC n=1 Tax=Virgibacillus oceani TaxID=1479511 RepID=A0A917HSE1_9BACI|nr:class I SAM-dependent methyltransferase [Virgibacillus oceani]GGG88866.1 putative methyltransferase YdaC [Virgibacillus oceani]